MSHLTINKSKIFRPHCHLQELLTRVVLVPVQTEEKGGKQLHLPHLLTALFALPCKDPFSFFFLEVLVMSSG